MWAASHAARPTPALQASFPALIGSVRNLVQQLRGYAADPLYPGSLDPKAAHTYGRLTYEQGVRVPEMYQYEESPEHYEQLPIIFAAEHKDTGFNSLGTWQARKVRKAGLVPAMLDSLPLKQGPRHLVCAMAHINTLFRQHGMMFTNRLCLLKVVPIDDLILFNRRPDDMAQLLEQGWNPVVKQVYQVLPRRVNYSILAETLQSITFMNCPSTRIVNSTVPIFAEREDESPSAKKGGYALVTTKRVKVRSLATNIPLCIPVDCSELDTGSKVHVRDLAVAPGQFIVGTDPDQCVLKMETGGK